MTEGPVLARASGYIKKRYVDIGDRVKAGQVLAEIEAPELGQQIRQAQATIDQANSSVQQAEARCSRAAPTRTLSQVTAAAMEQPVPEGNRLAPGQRYRRRRSTEAQQANVQALEKAVAAGTQQCLGCRSQSRALERTCSVTRPCARPSRA